MKSLDCREGIVYATLEGDANILALSWFFRETLAFLAGRDSRGLLVDLKSASLPLSVADVYYLPATLEGLGLNRRCKVAWLMKELNRETNFYELVFVNEGFTAKIFTDADKAESWLAETALEAEFH